MPSFFPGPRENIAVPDDRKGQIVFKWPDHEIRRFSYAIVEPDEMALFTWQGEVKGTLGPGRHQLDATEIPFLGIFADAVTGGNLYRTEIYFVGTHIYPDLRFGGSIDNVQDPVTGMIVTLGVYGEYALKVTDPARLVTNLTGTVDVTNNAAITDWVTQQLLKVLRQGVTQQVTDHSWAILALSAHTAEIEAGVTQSVAAQLANYGLEIPQMGNFVISLNDDDLARLKQLANDTAYSRLAGSFQQYAAGEMQLGAGEGMAKGGQGVGGAFIAAGMGLGGQAAQPAAPGPTPPPPPALAGGAGFATPNGGATVACSACATANPVGAKFCQNCGAALAAAHHCSNCGAEVPAGAKFCPGCGQAVEAAPAAGAPSPPPDAGGSPPSDAGG